MGKICVSAIFFTTSCALAAPSTQSSLQRYAQENERVVRFLEDRVKSDPDDITALNRLAGVYLQRARETGSIDYLLLADRKVKQSLAAVAEDGNADGLAMRSRVAFESHDFVLAKDCATRLTALVPHKAQSFAFLGDALLELGDYDGAKAAYDRMRAVDAEGIGSLTRLARYAYLTGNLDSAPQQLADAEAAAARSADSAPEALAWCRWQLGELAFAKGDYADAERWDQASLEAFPSYFRALASLGRVRAARGDLPGAIAQYEHAIAIIPDPTFVAALGDLYHLVGRERDARQQYDLVAKIARLTAFHGALYNRQFALFRADHELDAKAAFADAAREYAARKDIYGADALAWTALRAGRIEEARAASKESLRLGTPDARLLYHAGMIALAAADRPAAADLLRRATALCPHFDPLQARICVQSLNEATRAGP